MRSSRSLVTSATVAALFTHGMVFSALNFDPPLPIWTYQGFFRHILLATERLWSYAHGWQPLSHIRDFGHFYATTVHLTCPLVGFLLFWIASRRKVGISLCKPLAIASLLTLPNGYTTSVPGYALPWVEAARTILVLLLMLWSVGAIRIPHSPSPILNPSS
jgi:hypothetical protein